MIIGMERAVNGNLKPKQATFHIKTSFWMKTQKNYISFRVAIKLTNPLRKTTTKTTTTSQVEWNIYCSHCCIK